MALTVGTDTYISVADANSYLALFDKSLPEDLAEALLKKATLAMDRLYASQFIGGRISDNPLEWPRVSASHSNTGRYLEDIPNEVAQATAELAYLLDSGVDPYTQPEALVKEKTETVDVITLSQKFEGVYRTEPLYSVRVVLKPVLVTGGTLPLAR